MSRHHEQYKRQTVWNTAELRFLICEVKGGLDPNAPIRGSSFLFILMPVTDMANQSALSSASGRHRESIKAAFSL